MGLVLAEIRLRPSSAFSSALLSFALASCATHTESPADLADRITRAVYANDLDTTSASFDEATKRAVTRTDLGALSDRMHALGTIASIKQRSGNADTGRYEFDVTFTSGSLLVQMRVDPSGRVGAYRVIPIDSSTPPTPSPKG